MKKSTTRWTRRHENDGTPDEGRRLLDAWLASLEDGVSREDEVAAREAYHAHLFGRSA